MEGLMKYGLSFFLLLGIFLFASCTDEDSWAPDEEQVMVSLNFSSSDRTFSRGSSDSPVVSGNAENFLKTLRILVFSEAGEKKVVYNKLFSPAAYQTWTTQLYIKPGTYTFHAVANEASCMTETLKNISNSGEFHNLPCMDKVKREDGMIRDNSGHITAFLMKGEVVNVNVHKPVGTGNLIVTIPLKRLLAKVEMRFENALPSGITGGFKSFSLGVFPRYFSYFREGCYPLSAENADTEKEWRENSISTGNSYIHYIPPYTPVLNEGFAPYSIPKRNRIIESYDPLLFMFNWYVGGYQDSKIRRFRESDENEQEIAVKSNYHYKYVIRLSKKPNDPLEVQCTISPWVKEGEQNYYVDDCCNLKIVENEGGYTKFILQHVDQDPTFEFSKKKYFLEFLENDNTVWYCYMKYNDDASEKRVGDAAEWDGYKRRYILPFKTTGQGKSIISIRYTGNNSYYGRCYFNETFIYGLHK